MDSFTGIDCNEDILAWLEAHNPESPRLPGIRRTLDWISSREICSPRFRQFCYELDACEENIKTGFREGNYKAIPAQIRRLGTLLDIHGRELYRRVEDIRESIVLGYIALAERLARQGMQYDGKPAYKALVKCAEDTVQAVLPSHRADRDYCWITDSARPSLARLYQAARKQEAA